MGEKAVKEALDLCLACKGCKAECPSGVDLAKLKFEFMDHYYKSHRRPIRDYLFGYINELLKMGAPLASLLNRVFASRIFRRIGAMFFGLAYHRRLPLYTRYSLDDMLESLPAPKPDAEPVLVMLDAYNRYFYPENCRATMRALIESGCRPIQLPIDSAGRSLLSKGLLEAARIQARRVLSAVRECDPKAMLPLVGIEPSEIYTLRDEFLDLITNGRERTEAEHLANRTYSIEEFLVRPGKQRQIRILRIAINTQQNTFIKTSSYNIKLPQVLLHTHCYQKTQPPSEDGYPNGGGASVEMLKAMGYNVSIIDAGCCGMAGSFGYESEHYDLSMSVGEDRLFPAVRAAGEGVIIAAAGVSCHSQIKDGTGRNAVHPIRLLFPGFEDFRTAKRQCEQAVER
jgi:Fe-S oxidoreductase